MKKIWIILLFTISCGKLMADDVFTGIFNSGNGSSQITAYVIQTKEQLSEMANIVNANPGCTKNVWFRLGANINVWQGEQPIGISEETAFQGYFNGAGFSIRSFWQIRPYADDRVIGFFGYTLGGRIWDLTIDGGKIYDEQGKESGVLIGNALGTTIDNCFVRNVDISVSGNATGGFIGYARAVIINGCSSDGGSVTGSSNVGGFIGKVEDVKDLFSELCGVKNTIIDCFSSCLITGVRNVGGFIGVIESPLFAPTEINGCYATGSVLGFTDNAGGFIGACQCNMTAISNSYAAGSVTGASRNGDSQYIGGFIGLNAALKIERCYASGAVTGNSYIGGFSGGTRNPSDITCCYAVGSVEGEVVGGFAGTHSGGRINKCFATGAVITQNPDNDKNLYGGFVGLSAQPALITDCYFDMQTTGQDSAGECLDEEFTHVYPSTTSALTQPALSFFSSGDWLFSSEDYCHYPQLRVFADQNAKAETRLRSALSVVPFKLANDTESCSDLKTVVTLIDKMRTGDAITWFTEPYGNVTILNNATVYAGKSDAWRTLTLRSGDMERSVRFRSTKGMTTAEIMNVIINHKRYDTVEEEFTHHIDCEDDMLSVFVEINLSPYSTCEPGSPVLLRANDPLEVTVKALDGNEKKYTFLADRRLPSEDIFVQRWNDVLAVNNNHLTNGGYTFTAYEWYKNGILMPDETKGYIRFSEPANYTAKVTTHQGDKPVKLTVCPIIISDIPAKATVYPNPANGAVSLEFETAGVYNVSVTDMTGMVLMRKTVTGQTAQIDISDHPVGVYLLTIDDGKQQNTIRIIKN